MRLDLQEGSHLYSAAGENLGTVRQFVIQPSTAELTHVLVEKGVFFTDDRVVPIETIDRVEDERVILGDEVDPSDLPHFVRDDYAPIDEETRKRIDAPTGSHYMWRHPTALVALSPMYPVYPMPTTESGRRDIDDPATHDRLAESQVLGPRTPVVSTRGEKVGTVSEMQVDESGQLSHLVVDLGFLSGEKVLPAHWIDSMASDGVRLAVGDSALETLETLT